MYTYCKRNASVIYQTVNQRNNVFPSHTRHGDSPDEFNTHALRIGAATQSFLNGMDEKTIMANGRWKSSCYKRYNKTMALPHLASLKNNSTLN
jgi:hypothetical protein